MGKVGMDMYPSLEQIKNFTEGGSWKRIPVYREVLADRYTPVEVVRILRAASCHCFLLESAEDSRSRGRYSFLGYNPALEITCTSGVLTFRMSVTDGDGEPTCRTVHTEHPADEIRRVLSAYKSPQIEDMPPFTGGLVGYFSYEYFCYAEPGLRAEVKAGEDFRDVDLMLFDKVIVFDHLRQTLMLITGVDPADPENSYRRAEAETSEMLRLLRSGARADFRPLRLRSPLEPRFTREQYAAMVDRAKSYIREGDIFQVVLSNPMTAEAGGSLFDVFRILRATNPSPYMFYFVSDDMEIAGASPETLVKLDRGVLHTFPLAGTRPRGATPIEDEAIEKELLQDEKELSEHTMLVDLGRNDLGKISRLGSVAVEKSFCVERFSHVMHIASTVVGRIRDDRDALDAIDAVLPAGTLSGAPKLRACEIIRELEGAARGIYGGAVGYIDFSGNLDACIAIRLAYKRNGRICVQAGAGIVADSAPDKEYEECRNKARAVTDAITRAEGGLPE